jgi:hypothetical protein
MEFARLCEDERIRALVHRWDTVSHYDQRRISLEELCQACGIPAYEFLGAVASSAFRYCYDVSSLIAAVAHPKVVEASIKRALRAEGVEDRRMQLVHSGFLPTPRGAQISINAQARAYGAAPIGDEFNVPDFAKDAQQALDAVRAWEEEEKRCQHDGETVIRD